jgi:hypothetical protein
VEPGVNPLVGVGGYAHGTYPANMAIVINDTTVIPGGNFGAYQFFGSFWTGLGPVFSVLVDC